MCRNIRLLHHFTPPTTQAEIHDAALQFVRKVSGMTKPSVADQEVFASAVTEIATSTQRLLDRLSVRGSPRTREGERDKAKLRWKRREERVKRSPLL